MCTILSDLKLTRWTDSLGCGTPSKGSDSPPPARDTVLLLEYSMPLHDPALGIKYVGLHIHRPTCIMQEFASDFMPYLSSTGKNLFSAKKKKKKRLFHWVPAYHAYQCFLLDTTYFKGYLGRHMPWADRSSSPVISPVCSNKSHSIQAKSSV